MTFRTVVCCYLFTNIIVIILDFLNADEREHFVLII